MTVICWDRNTRVFKATRVKGVEIRRLFVRSEYRAGSRQIFYLPRFWLYALKEIYSLKPDVIHCHDLDTAPAGYWYARVHHIPWIFDAHEWYPELIGPQVNRVIYHLLLRLERFITPRATHVITVGNLHAERFRSFGGQVSVVGNYSSLNTFCHRPKITRSTLGFRPDDFIVAYIGGFTRARALLPIIKATRIFQDVTVLSWAMVLNAE